MEISLYVLVALLISSNIFWASVCLKLTNRLMSRNFGEYAQAIKKPTPIKPIPEDMSDPVAERHAREMNSLVGII